MAHKIIKRSQQTVEKESMNVKKQRKNNSILEEKTCGLKELRISRKNYTFKLN